MEGESERASKGMHGVREESWETRENTGLKDDWSETQLREVARKAAEDEEWKRGWRGESGDGWRRLPRLK